MEIGIINCDLDESEQTNGGFLINKLIPESTIIDFCGGEVIIDLDQFDGFVITGSRAHITDDLGWINKLNEVVKEIQVKKIPCLGICFGMDIVADVFGGEVKVNFLHEEGFKEIKINNESELFKGLPERMWVYESHHDITSKVPEGAKILAVNETCIQAFSYGNFYCIQFHPEISAKVAQLMTERDEGDVLKVLEDVGADYVLTKKIFNNFLDLIKFCRKN